MHSKKGLQSCDSKYHGLNSQKNRKTKAVSDHYKIPTNQINLYASYDLPFKNLQFPKKIKYKQNLNPIFEMFSTTNYRHQSFANIPEKESRDNVNGEKKKDAFQASKEYLIETINKTKDISTQIEESKEKLQMLREKIKMLKEKNLLKDRQINLIEKQKQKQQEKSRVLEKQLWTRSQKYKTYQEQHHQIYNKVKKAKQQLGKQAKWLQQQKTGIEKVREKLQTLLMKMKILEQQQDRREQYLRRMIEQEETNIKLQSKLEEVNPRVIGLQQELTLVQQQTQTLQMHQSQLLNLQLKFKKQTQKLQQHLNQLLTQFDHKANFISQQQQIDRMIKDLELQMGQMNQDKIIVQQHIQEIHLKISIKNRNIKHIQSVHANKFKPNQSKSQQSIYPSSLCRKPNQTKHLFSKDNINNEDNIFPLPTIRQQSNNTSLYQTPRNQQLFSHQQQLQQQQQKQKQKSNDHPFYSKQLEIDSRMFSRAEELLENTHKQKNTKQEWKNKKYFVIESEEDAVSIKKPFYCFKKNADYFIANGEKIPLIKQKPIQGQNLNENEKRKTQNDDPYSSSIELSSQNYNDVILHQSNRPTSIEKFSHNHNTTKLKQPMRQAKSTNIIEHPHDDSSEAFQTLVQQFQHIKSNSYFDQCWKEKI